MRVLFIDDDPAPLRSIEEAIEGFVPWDSSYVLGQREALKALRSQPHDVVVCASRDAASFIRTVKTEHPSIARIVIAQDPEVDATLRTLFAAHQLVAPDVEIPKLVKTISQAADLQMLLRNEELRTVVGKVERLPARPAVYQELVQLLAQPDADFRQVGAIVQTDPAIAVEIIRVVNTPFFSRGRAVTNVIDAVGRLGTRVVRDLVLAIEVFSTFSNGPSQRIVEKIQRHSVDVAVAARSLVTRPRDRDDAFLAGLLHDVGRLVIVEAFPAARDIVADETGGLEAEREALGVTHAEIGAYLVGLWGLPYNVMWAAVSHHEAEILGESVLDVAGAVYVAEQIIESAEDDGGDVEILGTWRVAAQQALGMKNAS